MPCIVHETPEERAQSARLHRESISGPLQEEISVLRAELAEREAMLCGVMSAMYRSDGWQDRNTSPVNASQMVMDNFDEAEAGVTISQLEAWWVEHQRKDEQRRVQEAAELEARKKRALKKLTQEERILLGLSGKVA